MGLAYCVRQTHLFQRQDIPLGGGKGRKTIYSKTENKRETEETRYWFIFFVFLFFVLSLPSFFLVSLPGRLWKGRRVRHTPHLRDERMKANLWVFLCVTCSVMLLWLLWPPLRAASPALRKKECLPEEWLPELAHHVDVGQRFPNPRRKNPTEKSTAAGELGWSCRLPGGTHTETNATPGLGLLTHISTGCFCLLLKLSGLYGAFFNLFLRMLCKEYTKVL